MPTLSRNSMTDIIEHSNTASFRSGIITGALMDCQAYLRLLVLEAYPGIPASGSSKIRLLMVFRVVAIRDRKPEEEPRDKATLGPRQC